MTGFETIFSRFGAANLTILNNILQCSLKSFSISDSSCEFRPQSKTTIHTLVSSETWQSLWVTYKLCRREFPTDGRPCGVGFIHHLLSALLDRKLSRFRTFFSLAHKHLSFTKWLSTLYLTCSLEI
ncbi:hypothetical protein T01_616 [Trichinella spiralis]|uniref:Uncharacterized protein n=1 Tax=Trichinella spiralis TaxID=6334 RepID=A0A0V1BK93_TRISP|nr:hypothetical protein T01_616 [Trichinella spiralis]